MSCPLRKWVPINTVAMVVFFLCCLGACAGEKTLPSSSPGDAPCDVIVNPLDSTCYDWRGNVIPCCLKRPYAELLLEKSNAAARFIDNKNGTVTDTLTKLIWLKNLNCFGKLNWRGAAMAAKGLKDGDCGPNPALVLADGSRVGDWRLPTMNELCTMIDFSRRDPALPKGHVFSNVPSGYHWSATTLDHHSETAWIVYFESGTTCYENIKNRAGHLWPVRGPLE